MGKIRSETSRQSRRDFLYKSGVVGSITLLATSRIPGVVAQDGELPHLAEDNPSAQALQYVHDAAQASDERMENEYCYNCQYWQSDQETEWGQCQIFPMNLVNRDGWCVTWVEQQ